MSSQADTNQANEDLKQKLRDTKTFNYNVYFGVDGGDYAISFDEALDEIVSLIRTEKLKLLGEVREQAGEYELNMHGFYDKDVSDQITAVPLEALNKLEAEL